MWAVLGRPLYRGEVVWGRTKKRDRWGQKARSNRDQADWISVDVPELQIVPKDTWQAVQARRADKRKAYLSTNDGERFGRPPNQCESKYLLTGLARCTVCGGSLIVRSRSHGKQRRYFYSCGSFHERGSTVCKNNLSVPMEATDEAVFDEIEGFVLHPAVVDRALKMALDELRPPPGQVTAERRRLGAERQTVDRELSRLTEAFATGSDLASVVNAIREREQRQQRLSDELASLDRVREFQDSDVAHLEQELRARLVDWRGLLRANVQEARQILRALMTDRLEFTPAELDGMPVYQYQGEFTVGSFVAGIVGVQERWRPQPHALPTVDLPVIVFHGVVAA